MARFSPEFLDEIRNRLKPSEVIGRTVRLKRRGDTWWGLSPFKQEKTPSFTVSDRRGTYHCFATSKHGNIFDYLMETERLSFPEAVERLAREAGLPLPARTPADAESARRRKGLAEACEAAAVFFANSLRRSEGRAGADYLKARGVGPDAIAAFRLGCAPDARTALKDHLINKGYTEDILVEAGLVGKPEEGGESYDRFRNRVIFPIASPKGDVIAFGGRALDREARAKYLNSPETPLFKKGELLYNFGPARIAAANGREPVIVCEGYMDVIALWSTGFKTAVAPLGTAITETQLTMLWRECDEPVVCLDGDSAGISAAHRLIDRALPLLKPGKSLRYVFLPDGQDPDDVVRSGGEAAFRAAIDRALPLVDVLWRREQSARPLDTPERRAAFRSSLRSLVGVIADGDVRAAYGAELARRLEETFSTRSMSPPAERERSRRPFDPRKAPARASAALKRRGPPSAWSREATLLAAVINHPALTERREADFLALAFSSADLDLLHRELAAALAEAPTLDSMGLKDHLQGSAAANTLERVLSDEMLKRQSFLRPEAGLDEVERGWSDALRHHLIAKAALQSMSETASTSFTDGEQQWKAAVRVLEEMINAKPAAGDGSAGADVTPQELSRRLERMRAGVESKRRR
jgi:DNA primase